MAVMVIVQCRLLAHMQKARIYRGLLILPAIIWSGIADKSTVVVKLIWYIIGIEKCLYT